MARTRTRTRRPPSSSSTWRTTRCTVCGDSEPTRVTAMRCSARSSKGMDVVTKIAKLAHGSRAGRSPPGDRAARAGDCSSRRPSPKQVGREPAVPAAPFDLGPAPHRRERPEDVNRALHRLPAREGAARPTRFTSSATCSNTGSATTTLDAPFNGASLARAGAGRRPRAGACRPVSHARQPRLPHRRAASATPPARACCTTPPFVKIGGSEDAADARRHAVHRRRRVPGLARKARASPRMAGASSWRKPLRRAPARDRADAREKSKAGGAGTGRDHGRQRRARYARRSRHGAAPADPWNTPIGPAATRSGRRRALRALGTSGTYGRGGYVEVDRRGRASCAF